MVDTVRTNLEIIKPSRRAPHAGDVFAFRPGGHPFFFGRVISTDAAVFDAPVLLIYLYRASSDDLDNVPPLRRDQLLMPPVLTNRLPFSRGYFAILKNIPITPFDVFPVHGFRKLLPPHVVDERGNPIRATHTMGDFGVHSYRSLDDAISKALNIPLVRD